MLRKYTKFIPVTTTDNDIFQLLILRFYRLTGFNNFYFVRK